MSRKHSRIPFAVALLGILALVLFVQTGAFAQTQVKNPLKPCKDVPAYQELKKARYDAAEKAAAANVQLTFDKAALDNKFGRYDTAQCSDDGHPHLLVDGRLDRAGDFLIPSLLFLWLAGALGWAGRLYLARSKGPEDEIIIDLPKAVQCLLLGLIWPVQAIPELISGKIRLPEERVTISPR
ncbi:photosystem I reaction center subunit III [Gloeobacter kilaueensis]|uniref:Photosystem I reaction center subunit III n=1 Tax=Gloeobacter kilaueensis (strain ATCC BAA-2537 / CCAP 1431/1 / ULC 316 / JS1) TaxID=1183438 RepID=U5QMF0_GLOK1|nr:photosystem I reaction center subunit III [Gloeobacter kilaueensis]AGY60096.1 photosystem I reaction center subunit III [Gloeobacter kilaueensis JS1]